MKMLPYILKPNRDETSTVVVYDAGVAYPFNSTSPHYESIMEGIRENDLDKVRKFIKLKSAIVDFTEGRVTIAGDELYYNGEQLHGAMVERIIRFFRDKLPMGPICLFLDNVMRNPSKDAQNELYLFMQECDLPLTDDGHFLAYKVVKNDYKDKHTGKMDNSLGVTVSMPREDCDPSRNNECSRGLHFCSKSYIQHFRGGNDRLMVVKVDPANVTAIPRDYNNAKGRACEYVIHDEIEKPEDMKTWHAPSTPVDDDEFNEGYEDEQEYCDDCGYEIEDCLCDHEEEEDEEDDDDTVATFKPVGGASKPVANAISPATRKAIYDAITKPGASVTGVANQFGVHRRSVGRIRDNGG